MNMKIIPVTTDYERKEGDMAKQVKKKVAKVMPKKKVKKIKKK